MLKTLKIRIYPNNEQEVLIARHFGSCRYVWNYFLEQKIREYKENGKSLTAFDMMKNMKNLKKQYDWLSEINSQSLQQIVMKLDTAYKSFFKHNTDFPKFKSKKDKQYFIVPQHFKILGNKLILPKFEKSIKFMEKHKIPESINQIIITKDIDRYYASLVYESNEIMQKGSEIIGIDLGLKSFATLSNGIQIENPKNINRVEKRIKKQQQKLSRKKKGSKNRKKQVIKIQKLYKELTDKRTDFLNKVSTAITKRADTIVVENLNVQGMMQNHHLANSIADVSWYDFKQKLIYKSKWRNIELIELGRFDPSSKICSKCGWIDHNLKLSDREFKCAVCDLKIDRDLNAALNIRNIGLKKVGKGIPKYTPVEIATTADPSLLSGTTSSRSMNQEPHQL